MRDESRSAWARAVDGSRSGVDLFITLPGRLQLAFAAALVLILGALLPWSDLGPRGALGVETGVGRLSLVIGATAVVLVTTLIRAARASDSGGVAGLGLLATALVGLELIRTWARDVPSPGPGLWLSAGAAVVLLICGIHLLGAKQPAARSSAAGRTGD